MPPATDSATALKNLQGYQSSMQTPDQAATAANQSLGVDAAQQQVSGLRGAIAKTTGLLQQVAPSVYGRTQNSLVTNAQATKQIANEQAPINTELNQQQQDYSGASQDYQTLLNEANQRATNTIQGQQGQMSYLQQIYGDLQAKEQGQRDEAFRQAQLAEQTRQANLSASTARANAASASPTFGSSPSAGAYSLGTDKSGGLQFSSNGKPITLAQYVNGTGGNWNTAVQLLAQSKNPGDAQIIKDSSTMSQAQLVKKYPYVFGGM